MNLVARVQIVRGSAVLAWCGAAGAVAAQACVLDQSSPRANAMFNESPPSLVWQQQIRCGVSGRLERIRVTLVGARGAMVTARVRLGGAPSANPPVFTTTLIKRDAAAEDLCLDVHSANVQLHAGDLFVLETAGNNTGANLTGTYVDPEAGPARYAEPLYLNGGGLPCGVEAGVRDVHGARQRGRVLRRLRPQPAGPGSERRRLRLLPGAV